MWRIKADRGVAEACEAWAQGVARRRPARGGKGQGGSAGGMVPANVRAGRRRVSAAEGLPDVLCGSDVALFDSWYHSCSRMRSKFRLH